MRAPALLLLLPLAACDGWPLYANLPPESPPAGASTTFAFDDEDGLGPDEAQDLGRVGPPADITVQGGLDGCGWDPDGSFPTWPDEDLGWFGAERDLFELRSAGPAVLVFELTWDEAPVSGFNAPYRPEEPFGRWSEEADLDVLPLGGVAAGADVLSLAGFTRNHPERLGYPLAVADGESVVLAVGCHHGLPTDYTLRLRLDPG